MISGKHIYKDFNEELAGIVSSVKAMGVLVNQQMQDALHILRSGGGDAQVVATMNDREERIDQLEVVIDHHCVRIITRRQPIASDLRLLIATTRIVNDLERMGDEANNIGRLALELVQDEAPDTTVLNQIDELSVQISQMIEEALRAFVNNDAGLALETAHQDALINRRHHLLIDQLITTLRGDYRHDRSVTKLMWAIHALERISNRACNLCESVIYLVKGIEVRHLSLQEITAQMTAAAR